MKKHPKNSIFRVLIEKQTYRSFQCLIQRKNTKNYGKTLADSVNQLDSYLSEYQYIFENKTKKFFDKAEKYVHGLFISNLRNIERICEEQVDADYFQMQYFITNSKWNAREAIDHSTVLTSRSLPKRKLTGLIIDETGTVKKGKVSVGVGWQ